MQEISDWLKKLGMAESAQRFADNDIEFSVLRHLTDQDLKELRISLGHRRKMLAAIAELPGAAATTTSSGTVVETRPKEAERRELTVMFCDLVGSTALSARFEPEDLRSIIAAYHQCCTELVERNGGSVDLNWRPSAGRAEPPPRRQATKLREVHAATSLACLWRDQGKRVEARDLLATTYNSFTEGFDTPVLRETKLLLQQLAC